MNERQRMMKIAGLLKEGYEMDEQVDVSNLRVAYSMKDQIIVEDPNVEDIFYEIQLDIIFNELIEGVRSVEVKRLLTLINPAEDPIYQEVERQINEEGSPLNEKVIRALDEAIRNNKFDWDYFKEMYSEV